MRNRFFWRFVRQVARRFQEDSCLRLAASLTFTTLLALVPLVTITLTVVSAFPVFGIFMSHVDDFIAANMLPGGFETAIAKYIDQFTLNASRLRSIGFAFLAVTAFLLMLTIDRAFNAIWRVRRQRPLLQRVVMYWAILTLGPLLIGASLTMTTYVVSMSMGVIKGVPEVGDAVLRAVPFLFAMAAFTLLYYVVPYRRVSVRHAVFGGAVAGILFEIMKRGFALYITYFPTYKLVYGAFASIPVFLLWIYLSWVVTVLGAIVTALAPDYRNPGGPGTQVPGTAFVDALALLKVLVRAQIRAEAVETQTLCVRAGLPRGTCDSLLEEMARAGWVARLSGDRWALICNASRVRIGDIYRQLVFRVDAMAERLENAGLSATTRRSLAHVHEEFSEPLSTLADEANSAASEGRF